MIGGAAGTVDPCGRKMPVRPRGSGIAGAGLSLYARLKSHFNITNVVI